VTVRIRLRATKLGKVRFTSHRDAARIWERALRRADVPVAYTEGFSPRPRLHFGLALSVGHESLAEYLDVDVLSLPCPVEGLPERLTGVLPSGFGVTAAAELAPGAPSLQEDVVACSWRFVLTGLGEGEVRERTAAALEAGQILAARTRKGVESVDDLRPAIEALVVVGPAGAGSPAGGGVTVDADLATKPRGLRPSELVDACYPGVVEARVTRLAQWIERQGVRSEPLPARAIPVAPALAVGA
jgi:radical SAM-linked protein